MADACCSVGARQDAGEIDAALRAGGPDSSVRRVAERFGLGRTAVSDHRGCLGLRGVFPVATAGQGSATHETPRPASTPPSAPPADVSADIDRESDTEARTPRADIVTDRADSNLAVRSTPLPQPARARQDPSTTVTRGANGQHNDLVTLIANMIAFARWRDHESVKALASRFGQPDDVIRRCHLIAAGVVRRNRGTKLAQLEGSIAVTKKMRDDEVAYAERQDAESEKCLLAARTAPKPFLEYNAAKAAKRLASMSRATALSAQAHMDKLLHGKPIQIVVSAVQADPGFEEAWGMVRDILEALHPLAMVDLDEGVGVGLEGGKPALRAWVAERRALVLEEHDGVHEVAR